MIETPRLLLRSWREEDVELFDRHTNTPAVMRWLGGTKSREVIGVIIDRLAAWEQERGFTFWAVERKADAAMLGFCGLKIADDVGCPVEGEMEIGWRFREDVWGQGYAGEAARASLDAAFDRFGASRVVSLTVAGNRPSVRLMERLGMTLRPDLGYQGPDWAEGPVIIHVIERETWQAR